MKRSKAVLAILTASALALGLVGCGGTSDSGDATTGAGGGTTATQEGA